MPSIRDAFLRNWPLKLAAVTLSVILWVVVAAEETTSALVDVRLEVEVPGALALARPAPPLRALVTGPGRELIKLSAAPLVARAALPADAQPPGHRLVIGLASVEVPRHAKVTVQDVAPREFEIAVDRFARRNVPVAVRGLIEAESGFAVTGHLTVTPRAVEVSGPRGLVYGLDSVRTEFIEVRGVTDAFERTVPLDTARPLMRISPREVHIAGRVRRL